MFSLSRERAGELVARIWAVVREWKTRFGRFGVGDQQIDKIAPAFRHLDEVSVPETRKFLA
jgi:serine/threonine-protein kinase HipA